MPHRKLKHIVEGQKLVHVEPTDTVAETVKQMQQHHVGTALVLENGALKGIFTGSNLVERVHNPGLDPRATKVADVMTPDPHCLHCEAHGIDSVRAMREKKIRHVVVEGVGEKGYAIVSVRDFPDEELGDYDEELAFEDKLWEEL